ELVPPATPARARALIALCFWRPDRPAWPVEELDALTRELDDTWLRIRALNAVWLREFAAGRYASGLDVALQAYALEAGVTDPNVRAELREATIPIFTLCGRLDDSRRRLAEYDDDSVRLSPITGCTAWPWPSSSRRSSGTGRPSARWWGGR